MPVKEPMTLCTFDNPSNMRWEEYRNKRLIWSVSVDAALQKVSHDVFVNMDKWVFIPGKLTGELDALPDDLRHLVKEET